MMLACDTRPGDVKQYFLVGRTSTTFSRRAVHVVQKLRRSCQRHFVVLKNIFANPHSY